jgi:hypothetical protein
MLDLYTVATDTMLLYLEPDPKMKNVTTLLGWFTFTSLAQIKRNLDNPDSITFLWRDS